MKLESHGIKIRRGVNATAQARKELGLKSRAKHEVVLAALDQRIAEWKLMHPDPTTADGQPPVGEREVAS